MTRPADFEARQRALDPARSFIVQAPAGSGKTEVLTQRFLRLLATVERPERVLAITFTRKATQQMRTRISARLAQAEAGECPEAEHDRQAVALASEVLKRDRARGWNLLQNPGRLRINTIDGLCTQLLARDPLHGPRWSGVTIKENADPLFRDAVARLFRDIDELAAERQQNAQALQDALVRLLVHVNGDSRRLEKLLVDMLRRRNLWQRHVHTGSDVLAGLLAEIQQRAVSEFREALGGDALDEAAELTRQMRPDETGSARAESELHEASRLAGIWTAKSNKPYAVGSLARYVFPDRDRSFDVEFERFKEIYAAWLESPAACEALERMASWPPLDVGPAGDTGSDSLLDAVRSVLSLLLEELKDLMAETGRADFTAIADAALDALGGEQSPGEVLLAEDARIDHILMDEFQDSSYAQFQLLGRLTDGWQQGDGRSLFLVGDPMQSIYRFREANVGFFSEVVRLGRLGQVPIEALRLQSNFRSRADLVDWFNRSFSGIFPPRSAPDSGAVPYTPVCAELPAGGQVGLHAVAVEEDAGGEARRICELIEAARQELDDPNIAILVRTRKQVPDIAAGLAAHGIEFEAVDAGHLAGRGAVHDLLILTRALVHPLDRVAWIALLRAPWCGLGIADIHRVVGDSPGQDVRSAITEAVVEKRLEGEMRERLARVSSVMSRAHDLAGSQALAERVQMCWIQLGGPLACKDLADLENAETFLELLEEVEHGGRTEIVERLQEALQYHFAASRPARVQIMTIHKAKGLEFEVVIVPGLERGTGGSRETLVALQEFSAAGGNGSGVLMAPLTPMSMAEISLYRFLNRVDAERDRFEDQRVLYVACTRAMQQLHLIATAKAKANGEPAIPANTFLDLLAEPFYPQLQEVIETQGQAISKPVDALAAPPAFPLMRLAATLPETEFPEPPEPAMALGDLPRREAVALGSVVHRWLELAQDHPEVNWDAAHIERSSGSIRDSLAREGVPPESLDALLQQCLALIVRALADPELQPAIGAKREGESWSELEIYRREGMQLRRYVIDLLLRDADGSLRIIDYKSGVADPGSMQGEDWQAQVQRYRELIQALGVGPVSGAGIMTLGNSGETSGRD